MQISLCKYLHHERFFPTSFLYHFATTCTILLSLLSSISATSSQEVVTSLIDSTDVRGASYYDIPDLDRESYTIPGHINIGAVIEATEKPKQGSGKLCTTEINSSGSWVLQYMEALAYAVRLVNENPDLLPNVTLGLVILDYCGIPSAALAQALSFVPRNTYDHESTTASTSNYSNQGCSSGDSYVNDTSSLSMSSSTFTANSSSFGDSHTSEAVPHYDVTGVIGPFGSELSLPMSYLYTAVKLPLLSYMATSDELSDTFHHRYFLRVVPPDRFQAQAMLKFIYEHGWSYVSVLYQEGAYGERGYENIRAMAPAFNICIATFHRMGGLRSDYSFIVSQLLKFPKARVVILFSLDFEVRQLFHEVQRQNAVGHFIWIGSDGMADRPATFRDFPDVAVGAITFIYNSRPVEEFFQYFGNLTVNSTDNPWFKSFWEAEHQCSFKAGTCDATKSIDADRTMKYSHGTSLAIDCILTFARAIDKILRDLCPSKTGTDARECVDGETLLKYLLNTSFAGYTDLIRFDEKGDAVGKYQIKQIVLDVPWSNYTTRRGGVGGGEGSPQSSNGEIIEVPIGIYEASTDRITYEGRSLLWEHLDSVEDSLSDFESLFVNAPASICSRPCHIGEYKIEKEVPCCWECRSCRDNEKLVDGNTRCEACPIFTWPDPFSGYTTCIPIQLSYPRFYDTLPIIQVCFAIVSIIGTLLISVAYVFFRNERVIKAASRELSFLQLVAILVGYISVIVCQSKPTEATCGSLYFMFCLSFAWLYAPLLVKTIRIYRIFQSGSLNNKRPKFVSPRSQLMMSGILIGIQVLIAIVVMAVYQPTARRYQPVWSEKYVELSCDLTLPGVTSFLSYNLVLVTLTSAFAFKTRKLPDNFNESRFISMCVSTTLVIWLAFAATYFTADRAKVRILIMSLALLLNHTVALIFLYLPKIYAVTFLPNEVLPTNNVNTRTMHTATGLTPGFSVQ